MFALAPLPRKLEAALRDIQSEKLEVRISALRDLVRHARGGEAQAARALRQALTDAVEAVRAEAALGLSDAESRESAEALAKVARLDASVRVRQMAILSLGELGQSSPQVLAVMSEARRRDAAAERFQALLALHQLRAEGAEASILEGMLDPDPEVRRLAFRVARAHFSESRELSVAACQRARTALSDEHPGVRAAAALTLAEYGDVTGKPILLDLVARRGGWASTEDEQAAIELVAELRFDEAVPALRRRAFARLMRDPHAHEARIALARLGDDRARAVLLRGLRAWTRDGRTLAVAAIGRARIQSARERLTLLSNQPERADPAVVHQALALIDQGSAGR